MISDHFDPLERCGSVHPLFPELVCIRMGGKCFLDDHIGILDHSNGFREIVTWGKDRRAYLQQFGRQGHHYRFVPVLDMTVIK